MSVGTSLGQLVGLLQWGHDDEVVEDTSQSLGNTWLLVLLLAKLALNSRPLLC
jgi:hypothetical protein